MRPSRSQFALGLICILLSGLVGAIELLPDPAPSDPAPGRRDVPNAMPPAGPRLEPTLAELKSRPPFWQDRRVPAPLAIPATVPAAAPPSPPLPPPSPPSSELTLVGVVNGPGGRIAILRLRSSGKLERHGEGDVVGQWSLKRILVDRVVFDGAGAETELSFPAPGEGRSTAANVKGTQFQPLVITPSRR